MSVILQSSAGGQITLQEPATASNFTQTLPSASGTVMVSGNMPAFSAFRSGSTQLISNTTWTKVELNAENFDTANCFDSTTNYRFTPNVAGYYQINGTINTNYSTLKRAMFAFYKNGSIYLVPTDLDQASATGSSFNEISGSTLVYMNGSTDYLELYVYLNGTNVGSTLGVYFGSSFTQFSGYLARSA